MKVNMEIIKDFEKAAEQSVLSVFTGYADENTPLRKEKIALVSKIFKDGAKWQKKRMMADAIETTIDGKVVKVIVIDE